jgi:hypothetical protein
MSEYISYSTTAMDGGSGSAVRQALRRQGIFFHDNKAWATARQRAEQLDKLLKEEMDKYPDNSLNESETSDVQKEINRVTAMFSAFSHVEEFRLGAEALNGLALQGIQRELTKLRQSEKNQKYSQALLTMAIMTEKRIENLASDIQQKLCQVEKKVMFETVSASLHELGYLVEARGHCLRATRGQTCIWAEANPYGELAMDLSGFSGLSCIKEMARVEAELQKRGVILKRSASDSHGKPEGGALVKKLRPMFPKFKSIRHDHVKIKDQNKITDRTNR